jgi:hypothetical protein
LNLLIKVSWVSFKSATITPQSWQNLNLIKTMKGKVHHKIYLKIYATHSYVILT